MPDRACVICGGSLEGRRGHARYCGGPCRAEGARLRAILAASPGRAYPSLAQRLARQRKRT
jgi:hypothetical protein